MNRNVTAIFAALSDPTRAWLVKLLAQGEMNVTELRKQLRKPQPTVSHHLGLLRLHGIVKARQDRKQVYYSLKPEALKPALRFLAGALVNRKPR